MSLAMSFAILPASTAQCTPHITVDVLGSGNRTKCTRADPRKDVFCAASLTVVGATVPGLRLGLVFPSLVTSWLSG